jgi:hypothetical protein
MRAMDCGSMLMQAASAGATARQSRSTGPNTGRDGERTSGLLCRSVSERVPPVFLDHQPSHPQTAYRKGDR